MSEQNNTYVQAIGFPGLLTILFIALKLTNVIQWSWFYVLLPLTIPIICFTLFIAIFSVWWFIFKPLIKIWKKS